jgi:thiol-disulfide isomerase/thioredoxin
MKRATTVSAIAIAAAAIAVAAAAPPARAGESTGGLALGSKVPAAVAKTKMKNVDGKMLSIADVAGKAGTLVIFTCNHCPFAKAWEERIVELGNTYAAKGIGVVLVNANDPTMHAEDGLEGMQEHAKARAMKFPYVVDGTSAVARAFGASVTPEAFLFDKAGKLAYHGTIDDNRQDPSKVTARYLKDALDAVVVGKTPAVAETKGLGCSIKFRS